ncbi:hypothetical protein [Limosilactobacillus oris]|uniref:hypothetical protein n=2 Tax=Limosilactobacillus oris TaxID=1632 RepID=UPI0024B3A6F9|nr:hypothetical protein [Limosilactobacillus oris]WHO85987.1 hypothetical protein QLX69_01775 [Limosilactobacillus oris]
MTINTGINGELDIKARVISVVNTREGLGDIRAVVVIRDFTPLDFPVSRLVEEDNVVVSPSQRLGRSVPAGNMEFAILNINVI